MTARTAFVQGANGPQGLQAGDTLAGVTALPTATAAGQTPVSTGAGTTYAAQAMWATCAETALPAASTGLTGARRYLTDLHETRVCDGAAWRPDEAPGPASLGPFATGQYVEQGGAAVPTPLVAMGGPGTAVAVAFYANAATPADDKYLFARSDAAVPLHGFAVYYSATLGLAYYVPYGVGNGFAYVPASVISATGLYILAMRWDIATNKVYGILASSGAAGSVAASTDAIAVTYANPVAASNITVGANAWNHGNTSTHLEVCEIACWDECASGTEITNPQLAAVAAQWALGAIVDIAGQPKSFAWRPARDLPVPGTGNATASRGRLPTGGHGFAAATMLQVGAGIYLTGR